MQSFSTNGVGGSVGPRSGALPVVRAVVRIGFLSSTPDTFVSFGVYSIERTNSAEYISPDS